MTRIFDSMPACQSRPRGPSTPNMQRLTAITHARFSLFRFRSPLLTESRLLSLPVGTEMFHFPTFPPLALCVQARVTGLASSRVSPFGNPRITVWLSTPRGLSQIPTSFFGSWCQGIHRVPLETWLQILRCSRPLCSSQHTGGPLPGSGAYAAYTTGIPAGYAARFVHEEGSRPAYRSTKVSSRPSLQDPTTCQALPPTGCVPLPTRPVKDGVVLAGRHVPAPTNRCSTREHPSWSDCPRPGSEPAASSRPVLLRKEVIQPHLPVRLPCYDLVPIASPTFDGSLHKGWATGFGCYRLS
jgi:hypothetical protein